MIKQRKKQSNLSKSSLEQLKTNKKAANDDCNIYRIFFLISMMKILLIPTYHSTDFEVHRNWLAITHSLPINQWYINRSSIWTLDYPPFFAWFEYFLSQFAQFFDPEMLNINNLNYASGPTILFQRFSVIIADFVLLIGVKQCANLFCNDSNNLLMFSLLTLGNVGLLLVDHVHFQYNGFLLGILLISIAQVSKSRQFNILVGAVSFAALLNFKHIYLYITPAFTVWLLKWYCLRSDNFVEKLIYLGLIVVTVFSLSFGPFIHQLPQVLSRLFPFQRGLVHAYWAANAWALYIGLDKVLSATFKRLGWLTVTRTASMTGGLVEENVLNVLPTPTPGFSFILTFLSILPVITCLMMKKQKDLKREDFLRCLILCALSSFIFGWHVHEKAILTAIIPFCILASINPTDAKVFLILSAAGHTAILPLLFPDNLLILKMLSLLLYTTLSFLGFYQLFDSFSLRIYEKLYIYGLPLTALYESLFHKLIFGEQLPFLPLALISIYCAVGIIYSWIVYNYLYFSNFYNERNTFVISEPKSATEKKVK